MYPYHALFANDGTSNLDTHFFNAQNPPPSYNISWNPTTWVETAGKVSKSAYPFILSRFLCLHTVGGKAKPLKAPKKEKKEMDEDDIAFREKQKAGTNLDSCSITSLRIL